MFKTFIDLTGQRFGSLTIVECLNKGKHTKWKCICDCGNEKTMHSSALMAGRASSCGCRWKNAFQHLINDLTGKSFGYLTAIKIDGYNKWGEIKWLCQCKCEKIISVERSSLVTGNTKSCGCYNREVKSRRGENSRRWKGGRTKTKYGYIKIFNLDHPNSDRAGYVLEHVYIMQQHLGRPLEKGEKIHHKNGVRDDNRIENLELWIKGHPPCQRITDLIPYWEEMLNKYKHINSII
jgi:hypothetical protein